VGRGHQEIIVNEESSAEELTQISRSVSLKVAFDHSFEKNFFLSQLLLIKPVFRPERSLRLACVTMTAETDWNNLATGPWIAKVPFGRPAIKSNFNIVVV
jgi:hypothetical protein